MTRMTVRTAPAGLSPEALAIGALILGAATIGFAPILVRLTETGPAAAGFWRLLFALPALALMHLAVPRLERSRTTRYGLAGLAGLLFAGDLAFWHYGVTLTSVANATVLSNLSPIVVAIGAWMLFGDRPRPIFLAGVAVAIVGASGMALFADHAARPSSLEGDAYSVATAVWYGLYLMCVTSGRRGMPAATIMLYSSAVGAPVLLLVAWALGEQIVPASSAGWLACIGLGVVHVAGQGAIAWALGRLKVSLAAVVILVQPVVAAAAGALLFNESLTLWQLIFAAVALGGIYWARVEYSRSQATQATRPPAIAEVPVP